MAFFFSSYIEGLKLCDSIWPTSIHFEFTHKSHCSLLASAHFCFFVGKTWITHTVVIVSMLFHEENRGTLPFYITLPISVSFWIVCLFSMDVRARVYAWVYLSYINTELDHKQRPTIHWNWITNTLLNMWYYLHILAIDITAITWLFLWIVPHCSFNSILHVGSGLSVLQRRTIKREWSKLNWMKCWSNCHSVIFRCD